MTTGFTPDPLFIEHYSRQGGIELPERYNAVLDGIRESVPENVLSDIPARDASLEDLSLCHDTDYINSVKEDIELGRYTLSRGDTDICPNSYKAALRAAGAVISACDAVMNKEVTNAFCPVRPPGHHAERDSGTGFCIFNNAAIGARYLQHNYDLERVAIIDWDVHHGNGTQFIFFDDPSVFYFSTHQWPGFPGTGRANQDGTRDGKGCTLNCPHAVGSGSREILGSFRYELTAAMKKFKPQFIIISAGFDSAAEDSVGGFCLKENDFVEMTRILMHIADNYADGRIVSVLEGGYNLPGLAKMAAAHVRTLAE